MTDTLRDLPQSALDTLRDPTKALPAFGQVHDQKTSDFVKYDPYRITHRFQQEVLQYYANPPRTRDGQTKFLTLLTARQMGKSLTAEYAAYVKTAYNPGFDHVCIADTAQRAEYLHRRVHQLHDKWPLEIRSPAAPTREVRQLTFELGGRMRVLSAESGAAGIGQSPDSFHASECAFWTSFAQSMFLIYPSIINRDNALVTFECTPWEAKSDWHEHCLDAKRGQGRHTYAFFPFWDGVLNTRLWNPDDPLTNEEIDLLNRYGPEGMTKDNLAFRRFIMDTDTEIRRRPEMFKVFYPYDDVSCWIATSNAAIPQHALDRHVKSPSLIEWRSPPYQEYQAPEPDAQYVIGADPAGHAARDHASFQVLKVYDNEWTQVATYAGHVEPLIFTEQLIKAGNRYNMATIVVESNGVGQATLALLRDRDYKRIFYEKLKRPGFTSTSKSLEQSLGWLVDALLDDLTLFDKDTIEQLQSYKNDKRIEESATSEIARGTPSPRRRQRHHWDKVSALIMAIVGARRAPRRYKPVAEEKTPDNLTFLTYEAFDTYQNKIKEDTRKKKDPRRGLSSSKWYSKKPRR